jgi:hypothetical protein
VSDYRTNVYKLRRKGTRSPWQEESYRKAHELLKKTLVQAIDGMTKTQIHAKTKLSRTTIDKHLCGFMKNQEVMQERRILFWSTNYRLNLERYRLIFEILDKQEKAEAAFKTKVAIAQDTLKGEALNKRLDEIYLEELCGEAQILKEQKEQGAGTKEKEALVKDGIKMLRQFDRVSSHEERLEIMKRFQERLNLYDSSC